MREILFRGKRIDNGEWVEGYFGKYFDGDEEVICIALTTKETLVGSLCYEVNPSTVGQSTGLTDKNGKRIFEGDIVRFGSTTHQVVFERRAGNAYFGVVIDEQEVWGFCPSAKANRMEVIGNIHDHLELLEGD